MKDLQLPAQLMVELEKPVLALRWKGKELAADEGMERFRAGELKKLELEACVFVQRETPNRNFSRFKKGILGKFAKSFLGVPFLRDHEQTDLTKRGGTVLSSKLEVADAEPRIHQVIELVKPWAIEAALDGTLDRFSIGWHSVGRPHCSICDEPILSRWFEDGECDHFPGDEVEVDGETRFVEAVYMNATGIETSGVSVPAVMGTGIEGIRAALSAQVREAKERGMTMREAMAKALKLPDGATPEEVLEATKQIAMRLEAGEAALAETKKALDEANKEIAGVRQEQLAVKTEALLAKARESGRVLPEKTEAYVRELASKNGLPAAEAFLEALPAVVSRKSVSHDSAPEKDAPVIPESLRSIAHACGVTDEELTKFSGGIAAPR